MPELHLMHLLLPLCLLLAFEQWQLQPSPVVRFLLLLLLRRLLLPALL
jgi:hypothetical protein